MSLLAGTGALLSIEVALAGVARSLPLALRARPPLLAPRHLERSAVAR